MPRPQSRYLSGQDAEEDEDEHALEGVGDGEQIGGEGGLVEDVQHSKGPGGSQHEQQGYGTAGAGPAGGKQPLFLRHRTPPHPQNINNKQINQRIKDTPQPPTAI